MHSSKTMLKSYLDRFCNRLDVYGKQIILENTAKYQAVYQAVTLEVIQAHLDGHHTIGFYALSQGSASKWLCIDFDDERFDVQSLVDLFRSCGWRCLREARRPGRDGHVWLFFNEPVPAVHLRRFAHAFLKKADIPFQQVEIFPKQDVVGKVGSLVRGPLGIHLKPGANNIRGWFEDVPRDVQTQLEWLHGQQPNSATDLLRCSQELEARDLILKVNNRFSSKSGKLRSAPAQIDWLDYATRNGFKQSNQFWHGPCPSCRMSRHDRTGNHLNIHQGGALHCWRGCSYSDIADAIR